MKHYDYIIAGAGCAGLSFAIHLINSAKFSHSQILIIDRHAGRKNDRTWCYWETKSGPFDSIVSKKWKTLNFYSPGYNAALDIAPYTYKLIRSIDYYNYADSMIDKQSNIDYFYGDIGKIEENQDRATIYAGDQVFSADYIFNSLITKSPLNKGDIVLQQHFKGLLIECPPDSFDAGKATLMDFTIPQPGETAFMYVLPLSDTRALVEYTIFGKEIWPSDAYDAQLAEYITSRLNLKSYKILETELGSIPMSSQSVSQKSARIIQLGISGGQTKASTGYTFQFIQQHSAALVAALILTGNPALHSKKRLLRFHFYDSVLLRVLSAWPEKGAEIFQCIFQKNPVVSVLHFLDNTSLFTEEVKLALSLQKRLFIPAAFTQIRNIFRK